QPEEPEHRRDDRAEHHLEHGEIGEIELAGELSCAAHPRALEAPSEGDPDDQRGHERGLRAEVAVVEEGRDHVHARRASGATRYAAVNAASMNSQLPALRSAPPVSACPLVHPRASTAPNPITPPPAKAVTRRARGEKPGPRSMSTRKRPATS